MTHTCTPSSHYFCGALLFLFVDSQLAPDSQASSVFCFVLFLVWVQANSPTPAHPRDNSRSHTEKKKKTASRQTHTLNPSSLFSFQQQINKTEQSRPPGWIIFITVLLGPLVLPLKTRTTCWASVSENPRCVAGSHKGSQCRSLR